MIRLFKRVGLNIRRNLSKNSILFFLCFIVSFFILSTDTVGRFVNTIDQSLRERIGPTIYINSSLEKNQWMHESAEPDVLKSYLKYLDSLALVDGVKTSTYSLSDLSLSANSTYNIITDKSCDVTRGDYCHLTRFKGVSGIGFLEMGSYELEIIEGRGFTQEELDNGKPVAIISDKLMDIDLEPIRVGDTIAYDILINEHTYEVNEFPLLDSYEIEVVGIYKENPKVTTAQYNRIFAGSLMNIYVPSKLIIEKNDILDHFLKEQKVTYFALLNIAEEAFKLQRWEDLDGFLVQEEKLRSGLHPEVSLKVNVDNSDYENMIEPITATNQMKSIISIVVISLSSIILAVVVFIFYKSRVREIAIYVSLGEHYLKTAFVLLLETFIIATTSFMLAIGPGMFLGNKFIEYAIKNMSLDVMGTIDIQNLIYLDFNFIRNSYLLILLISVVCTLVPIIRIFKSNPKKTLVEQQ